MRSAITSLLLAVFVAVFPAAPRAAMILPRQELIASFAVAPAALNKAEVYLSFGFNDAMTRSFDYRVVDASSSTIYSGHIDSAGGTTTDLYFSNLMTTANFTLTMFNVNQAFNIDVINIMFFDYRTDLPYPYPDFDAAVWGQSTAPDVTWSRNHFQIVAAVPEPSSLALLAVGLLLAGMMLQFRASNRA